METNKHEAPPNSFLAVLQRKETQVETLSEASDLLTEAVKAAVATGKKASITLKLTLEPKLGAVNFTTKLSSSLPLEQEPLCIFYPDGTGALHRDDPSQKELKFTSHDGGRIAPEETSTAEVAG